MLGYKSRKAEAGQQPSRVRKRILRTVGLVVPVLGLGVLVGRLAAQRPRELRLGQNVQDIDGLKYSPDGEFLGVEWGSFVPEWWEVAAGQKLPENDNKQEWLNTIHSQLFNEQGLIIVADSRHNKIEARDFESKQRLWTTALQIKNYKPNVKFARLVADNKYLLVGDDIDGQWLLDAHSGHIMHHWDWATSGAMPNACSSQTIFDPTTSGQSRDLIASTLEKKTITDDYQITDAYRVELYDPLAAKVFKTLKFPLPQHGTLRYDITPSVFSPDGKTLAHVVTSLDKLHLPIDVSAYLWPLQHASPQKLSGDFGFSKGKAASRKAGNYFNFGQDKLMFSPDNHYLAAAGQVQMYNEATKRSTIVRTTYIWDAATGKLLHTLPVGGNLAFSEDSQLLVGMDDAHVSVYEVETERIVRSVPYKMSSLVYFAIDPGGKTLATAESTSKIVKLWLLAR